MVPHHGAKITSDDEMVLQKLTLANKKAYISFGHNCWHHPNKDHIDALINNGFDSVQATGGVTTASYNGVVNGNATIKNDKLSIKI